MKSDATNSRPTFPSELFDTLPEAVRLYIRFLESTIQQQQQVNIQQLETKVHDLELRLAKDSNNTGKPPTSGGLTRPPKSQRGKSENKAGGKKGHVGRGLIQVKNPNTTVIHTPTSCNECGTSLTETPGFVAEKRQVFDIPKPQIEVTEHYVEEKKCPCCAKLSRARFPENVRGPVQYEKSVGALPVYLAHQHFIPIDRVCQIFEDIFDITISPGTCSNLDEQIFEKLEIFERPLKTHLLAAYVLHFDETGIRCEKKLHWIHVAASQIATLYTIHPKRGEIAGLTHEDFA